MEGMWVSMADERNLVDSREVLGILARYEMALAMLDDYDHQRMMKPEGCSGSYVLDYEECLEIIRFMRQGKSSDLFGKEKDDSFRGSIGNIYQTFGNREMYPTLEEKAAHLLYFITKNHSFYDGNKRIAAALFLYFLYKNGKLFINGCKAVDDCTLVALTIMIAQSRPGDMEMMVRVVLNCLINGRRSVYEE